MKELGFNKEQSHIEFNAGSWSYAGAQVNESIMCQTQFTPTQVLHDT